MENMGPRYRAGDTWLQAMTANPRNVNDMNKTPNNGVQGTRHKVPGPLTPDVHMAEGLSTGQSSPVLLSSIFKASSDRGFDWGRWKDRNRGGLRGFRV